MASIGIYSDMFCICVNMILHSDCKISWVIWKSLQSPNTGRGDSELTWKHFQRESLYGGSQLKNLHLPWMSLILSILPTANFGLQFQWVIECTHLPQMFLFIWKEIDWLVGWLIDWLVGWTCYLGDFYVRWTSVTQDNTRWIYMNLHRLQCPNCTSGSHNSRSGEPLSPNGPHLWWTM